MREINFKHLSSNNRFSQNGGGNSDTSETTNSHRFNIRKRLDDLRKSIHEHQNHSGMHEGFLDDFPSTPNGDPPPGNQPPADPPPINPPPTNPPPVDPPPTNPPPVDPPPNQPPTKNHLPANTDPGKKWSDIEWSWRGTAEGYHLNEPGRCLFITNANNNQNTEGPSHEYKLIDTDGKEHKIRLSDAGYKELYNFRGNYKPKMFFIDKNDQSFLIDQAATIKANQKPTYSKLVTTDGKLIDNVSELDVATILSHPKGKITYTQSGKKYNIDYKKTFEYYKNIGVPPIVIWGGSPTDTNLDVRDSTI